MGRVDRIAPTEEQIKEVHDCSNCRFSRHIAPYKILLECLIDMETKLQPFACNRWAGIMGKEVSNV